LPVRRGTGGTDGSSVEATDRALWVVPFEGQAIPGRAPARTGRAANASYDGWTAQAADAATVVGTLSAARSHVLSLRRAARRGTGDGVPWHGTIGTEEDQLRGWQGGGVYLPRRVGRRGRHSGEWIVSAELASGVPYATSTYVAGHSARSTSRGSYVPDTLDWQGVGLILWAGPGYAVAGGVWYAGAVAGGVIGG
jgi:hypothetical protein